MKNTSKFMLSAAVAGLMASATPALHAASPAQSGKTVANAGQATYLVAADKDKHACKGANSCKGKGGCKSGDNGCKGKNSCKGKGGCATDGSKHGKAS